MENARPKQLVKYLSVASGLQLLESQALQWSSPNAFLSPFEINGRMTLSFSTKELLDSTVKNATAMIFADSRPQGDTPLIAGVTSDALIPPMRQCTYCATYSAKWWRKRKSICTA